MAPTHNRHADAKRSLRASAFSRTVPEEQDDKPTFDIETAEARLGELITGLRRQCADLEDAVEELKRRHQQSAPSPRPRRAVQD
jgi:hypothetical protein